MSRILQSIYTYCLAFVAKASVISFNNGFDTLSNCDGCLIRPSEAKPHPTSQRVGDSLGEATVFS